MFNNRVIIEKQETGKTTFLLNEIEQLILKGDNIVVLDSATEHEEKSLLKKIINKYSNSVEIFIKDENIIDICDYPIEKYIKEYQNHFPFQQLINNNDKIICFDLSYFLEKGHDEYDKTKKIDLYKYYRKLYNDLSQQIALITILTERDGFINNVDVITDEIEFPITDYDISLFQKNINFLSSVHPENSFGTFYNSFEKMKFKKYSRKD